MSDEIRVGDRFLIEVEVTSGGDNKWRTAVVKDCMGAAIPKSWLFSGKRLPRQIKQGDRVIVRAGCAATVVAIRKDSAWIVFDDESSWIYPLSDLTLDDKA